MSSLKRLIKKQYKKRERDFQPINNNSDVTHIYYDLTIVNNNTSFDSSGNPTQTFSAVPCSFSQQRQAPYLNNPSEYDVTVPYFHIDTNSFPLSVVPPIIGTSYLPKQTVYGYSIEGFRTIFGGWIQGVNLTYVPFYIYWKSEDNTIPVPSSPIQNSSLKDQYFYNYSYNYFLNLINTSIAYFINNISLISTLPYFSYDPMTEKFSYNNSPNMTIVLNDSLYTLFFGLSSLYVNFTDVNGDPGFGYLMSNNPAVEKFEYIPLYTDMNYPLVPTGNISSITQNYSSTSLWNPVVSIVFMSRNLNVINQLVAQPAIFGVNPNVISNNASVSNVLFEYNLARRAEPTTNYKSLGEYILTNLVSIIETGELQIDTYWKDNFGNLNQFFIESGSSFIMKILFRKKDFNY